MSEIEIGEFTLLFFGVIVLNTIAEIWNWKKIKSSIRSLEKLSHMILSLANPSQNTLPYDS